MSKAILITLVLLWSTTIGLSQWILPDTSILPRADQHQSIGIYNKSIYLLGGQTYRHQLVEYLISGDVFIDHGQKWGPDDVIYANGFAQYWTQINHILYILQMNSNTISILDLETTTFTSSYITNIPSNTLGHACIASSQTQLFVLGGPLLGLPDVFMYDLQINQWLNIPQMQQGRANHACIVHPTNHALYAIGGTADNDRITLSSIETIEIDNVQQKTWAFTEPLSQVVAFTKCVAYRNAIYVIGGADKSWIATNKVHVINVLTDEVTVFPVRMPSALADVAPIVVDDVLYVFGGWNGIDGSINTWMMYDLYISTSEPRLPSEEPTVNPTTSIPTTANPTAIKSTHMPRLPTSTFITSTTKATDSTTAFPSNTPINSPITAAPTNTLIAVTTTATDSTASSIHAGVTAAQTSISSQTHIGSSHITVVVTTTLGILYVDSSSDMLWVSIGMVASVIILWIFLVVIVYILKKYVQNGDNSKNNIVITTPPVNHNETNIVCKNDSDSDHENDGVTSGTTAGNIGQNVINVENVLKGSAMMTRGLKGPTSTERCSDW
eukprot:54236_1